MECAGRYSQGPIPLHAQEDVEASVPSPYVSHHLAFVGERSWFERFAREEKALFCSHFSASASSQSASDSLPNPV